MCPAKMDEGDHHTPPTGHLSFEMLVRYRRDGTRATMLLKNLSRDGARVEGLSGLRFGDTITLLLPSLAPKNARVIWVDGMTAELEFDRPLHPDIFETLMLHHGQWRKRSDADQNLHGLSQPDTPGPPPPAMPAGRVA